MAASTTVTSISERVETELTAFSNDNEQGHCSSSTRQDPDQTPVATTFSHSGAQDHWHEDGSSLQQELDSSRSILPRSSAQPVYPYAPDRLQTDLPSNEDGSDSTWSPWSTYDNAKQGNKLTVCNPDPDDS
ncbi:hypothetical protein M231_04666 [Tremella mesenterica]|uniref:Uncharacterized protein n=1 Tax=Tremella mesenterica TaxID=5217 RepID=A0A4V1M3U7_TREME|nr:hypothetical protein M231_04666 [Tremella mesenterica]